jgi:hypothetical protein
VRRFSVFALVIGLFSLASCHKYTAPSTAITCTLTAATTSSASTSNTCTDPVTGISLTVGSTTSSLIVGTSTKFGVSLSGNTNNVVNWQVNGIAHGDGTVGIIDSLGNYIAPGVVPSPAVVNVGAVSSEDSKLSTTLAITILPAPVVTITLPTKPIPPAVLSVTSGTANTILFKADVTGAPTKNVNWLVNGVLGGNAMFGTIDATGVYTAPLTPPIGSTVSVIAQSADFPPSEDQDTVTISGFSTSSFQGNFAFSMAGAIASGPFFRAGSFFADGAGNLQSGLEDINDAAGPTTAPISFVGTYTMASDGRGTMQFNDGRGSGPLNSSTFHFVLVNGGQLQIIGSDSSGTASGQANLQDLSAFNDSGLFGTFVFDFTGVHGASTLSQIGEFKTDGLGRITGGSIDINDGGTLSQFQIASPTSSTPNPSPYSINSNGRGTATIATTVGGPFKFNFYIVSRGSAKFVGTDTTQRVTGATSQQDPNAAFDVTSLNGNYAFLLFGSDPSGKIATAGSFLADGSGHLTSGVLDENVNGTPAPNVPFLPSGTIVTVGSSGRGTVTFSTASRTYKFVFYLATTGNAVLQETDSSITSDGSFALQQGTAFSVALIKGNYAIASSGSSGASSEVFLGQLTADGLGSIPAGTVPPSAIDINLAGALTTGVTINGAYAASPSTSERGTLTLAPSANIPNFAVYVISSTQAYLVGIDNGRLASGALFRQF